MFVPLQCNVDVTSLKVRSQMTRSSMIQTIYTFPGFNARRCIFTITVQHRCYLFEGQITNDKILHDSDYLYFPGLNARPHIFTITVFVSLQLVPTTCSFNFHPHGARPRI